MKKPVFLFLFLLFDCVTYFMFFEIYLKYFYKIHIYICAYCCDKRRDKEIGVEIDETKRKTLINHHFKCDFFTCKLLTCSSSFFTFP